MDKPLNCNHLSRSLGGEGGGEGRASARPCPCFPGARASGRGWRNAAGTPRPLWMRGGWRRADSATVILKKSSILWSGAGYGASAEPRVPRVAPFAKFRASWDALTGTLRTVVRAGAHRAGRGRVAARRDGVALPLGRTAPGAGEWRLAGTASPYLWGALKGEWGECGASRSQGGRPSPSSGQVVGVAKAGEGAALGLAVA
jgi:hypothetical protein